MLVSQLINQHLEALEGRRLKLAASISKYVMATFGGHNIAAITPTEVTAYIAARQKAGASIYTIAAEVGFLARICGGSWSKLWPSVPQPRRFYHRPTYEEVERLRYVAARSRTPWVRLFIDLATHHGMLKRDVCKLRWEDVAAMETEIDKQDAVTKSGLIATSSWRKAWNNIRRKAMVQCRFDDLRRRRPIVETEANQRFAALRSALRRGF